MKLLNEAYAVLKGRRYSTCLRRPTQTAEHCEFLIAVQHRRQKDIGAFGHCLSAFLCLFIGLFLLFLVRVQWILVSVAARVSSQFLLILFGVLMAHSAMVAVSASLRINNPLRRTSTQEAVSFGQASLLAVYGVYVLLTSVV
jgi:hypothetical protein